MIIKSIKETSYNGMFRVEPEEGSIFYIRKEYLNENLFNKIAIHVAFDDDDTNLILDAGLCCAVELKAISYLARAEQNRVSLTRKLIAKKYDRKYIEIALSYLEKKEYLSDLRFSTAWLNTRCLNHYEGRTKLLAELLSRGISYDIANIALDKFFTENDEEKIFQLAYEKLSKKKSGEKLNAALIQAGFTYKQIRQFRQ